MNRKRVKTKGVKVGSSNVGKRTNKGASQIIRKIDETKKYKKQRGNVKQKPIN